MSALSAMARFKAVIAVFNSVAVCSTPFAADTRPALVTCAFNASFCFVFKSEAFVIAVFAACFARSKFWIPFNAVLACVTACIALSTSALGVFPPAVLFKIVAAAFTAWE